MTWVGVALLGMVAWLGARVLARAARRQPDQRESLLRQYSSWRFYHLIALISYFAATLYLGGWGWAVQQLCESPNTVQASKLVWPDAEPLSPGKFSDPEQPPPASGRASLPVPGADLLLLAPFVVGLVLSWASFYDVDRALQESAPWSDVQTPFWSRSAYVGFHLRQNLALIFAPLLLVMAQKALLWTFSEKKDNVWLIQLAALILLPVVFVSLPWMLRILLGLRPLPPGPLRNRLLGAARRLDFRFSNILLWNTHGGVANAMVAGVLPVPRYVLLTDRLINELSPDEVEAVFGHEVGHVKHHHMLYYVGFLLISVTVVAAFCDLLITWVPGLEARLRFNEDWTKIPFIGIIGAYIFVVFGFVSRRCERQADIFGCRAVSCARPDCAGHAEGVTLLPGGRGLCATGIRTFIDALEKVARLNGMSRSKPGWLQSWQHSTIARRVEFLQGVLAEPALEGRFQRTVGRVKWALLVGLVAVLVLLGALQGWDRMVPF
jgi:Zn-dependent protease with chaperone function